MTRTSRRGTTAEVMTSYGAVRGSELDGVATFRGIPFAAPPTGHRRFAAPEPPAGWNGVLDASRSGAACLQPTGAMPGQDRNVFADLFGPGDLATGEDCLNLNVFAPAGSRPGERRPVMVWIHGGAFRIGTGSSPMYDGSSLARRGDVVVVSINYRLGVLGFLNHPDVGPANVGLLDQVAALRWVHDEIEAFGGDAANVTIFGESAGAKSVECLVAMPAARGLFRRAIAESTYDLGMDHTPAIDAARRLLADVGAAAEDGGAIDRDRLIAVPAEQLIEAMNRQTMAAMSSGTGIMGALSGWTPVIDGEVLPRHPREAAAGGDAPDVAMVIGTTRDEAALFTAMMPAMAGVEEAALPAIVGMLVGDNAAADSLVAAYRESRGPDARPADLLVAAMSNRMFRQHCVRLAESRAAHQPDTWMYLFDWAGAGMDGTLGACHALELPFVFGTLDSDLGQLAGSGPAAEALSNAIQDAWIAFARTGDPSTAALTWPRFDAARRATAAFGPAVEVRDAPLEIERLAWAPILDAAS